MVKPLVILACTSLVGCAGFYERDADGSVRSAMIAGTNAGSLHWHSLEVTGLDQTSAISEVASGVVLKSAISAASGTASEAIGLIGD